MDGTETRVETGGPRGRGRAAGGLVRGLTVAAILALALGGGFLAGMKSTLDRNLLFRVAWTARHALDRGGPAAADPAGHGVNAHGQLVQMAGKRPVPAPDPQAPVTVLFTFGQSNAANHGGEKHIQHSDRVLNFWNGRFYVAADPLLGATGISGSPWVRLGADMVRTGLSETVVLAAAGVKSTSVADWADGGRLAGMLAARLQEIAAQGLEVDFFLWHQGEADHAMEPRLYAAKLAEIVGTTRRHFPSSRFVVAQASRCGTVPPSAPILQAQAGVTQMHGVFAGPNTDLIGPDDRFDGCHFSGRGLARVSDGWLAALTLLHPGG